MTLTLQPAKQRDDLHAWRLLHLHAGSVVEKYYQALVEDSPNLADESTIEGVLAGGGSSTDRHAPAGQPARTRYRVLKRSREEFALLELQPVTGACICSCPALSSQARVWLCL